MLLLCAHWIGVFQHHLSCRPSLGRYVKITAISIDWVCWVDCGFGGGGGVCRAGVGEEVEAREVGFSGSGLQGHGGPGVY